MFELLSHSIARAGGVEIDPRTRIFSAPKPLEAVDVPSKGAPLVRVGKALLGAWRGAKTAWRASAQADLCGDDHRPLGA